MRQRTVTVVGARPQFVKAGVVSRLLRKMGAAAPFDEVLVHTGQHYDFVMSDLFFQELKIPDPKYALNVGSGSSAYQIGHMLEGLQRILAEEKPDAVLAYGDTNSTLAAALSAAHLNLRFVHIEAGERIFRRREVPEEVNRIVSDGIASLCLTSTRRAARYLCREGFHPERVRFVGDTMFDLFIEGKIACDGKSSVRLETWGLVANGYHLATIHRAQNTATAETLVPLLEALDSAQLPVLLPIHPRTKKLVDQAGWTPRASLRLIEPLGYYDFIKVLLNCRRVATDSGGVTREAFFAGKPCVIPMENSWWAEIVDAGWAVETGSDSELLTSALNQFEPSNPAPTGLFGDGHAAEKIVSEVAGFLEAGATESPWHRHARWNELPAAAETNFTWEKYRSLLSGLRNTGRVFRSFPEYLADPRTKSVLMRHDVDFSLEAAAKIAAIEAADSVSATYFFMLRTEHYSVLSREGSQLVREILSLGHHLGLHFDCAAYPRGTSIEAFAAACRQEAQILEDWFAAPVEIVSYHRPASEVLTGNPALSAPRPHTYMKDFTSRGIKYLSDSSGRWKEMNPLDWSARENAHSLHLLVHPIWWNEVATSPFEVLQQFEDSATGKLERSIAANCRVYQVGRLGEIKE